MWLYVKEAQRGNHKKGKGVVGERGKEKLDKLQEHVLGGDSWDKMLTKQLWDNRITKHNLDCWSNHTTGEIQAEDFGLR